VRVGDRASFFDPSVLDLLWKASESLRNGEETRVRRALMDGGTCEATAFLAHGHRAAGICAPVSNYHNMGSGGDDIATEMVSLSDLAALEELMVLTAKANGGPLSDTGELQSRMGKLHRRGLQRLTKGDMTQTSSEPITAKANSPRGTERKGGGG
jgi:hypothetical protein